MHDRKCIKYMIESESNTWYRCNDVAKVIIPMFIILVTAGSDDMTWSSNLYKITQKIHENFKSKHLLLIVLII